SEIDLSLRPGPHTWRATLNGDEIYEGTLDVRPREQQFVLVALEPPHGTPKLDPPLALSGNDWAWVFVATPYPRLRIDVDGRELDAPKGVCAFKLPFGRHEILLQLEGRQDVRRTLDIREQRLHSL